jgi:hypothetical protein
MKMKGINIFSRNLVVLNYRRVCDNLIVRGTYYIGSRLGRLQILMPVTQPLHDPGSFQINKYGIVVRCQRWRQYPDHLHLQRIHAREIENGFRR